MFPFNQSYRPRKVSPSLALPVRPLKSQSPVSPLVSPRAPESTYSPSPPAVDRGKVGMKRRSRQRPTPYTRRSLPTPSSPSEAEYEAIHEDPRSATPVDRIECLVPMQLYKNPPEISTQLFETSKDGNVSMEVFEATLDEDMSSPPAEVVMSAKLVESIHDESIHDEIMPTEIASPVPDEPIKYGDLVVVDYAERKTTYKWPAIVIISRIV